MSFFRETLHFLLQLAEKPEKTAFSFSIGVFIGFSPFLGLHTLLGVLTVFLFRTNKVATMAGVWSNVPWLVLPYYTFSTWLGIQLLGMPEGIYLPSIGLLDLFNENFWNWVISQWKLLIPAFVGSLVLSIILAGLAYPGSLTLIRRFREGYPHGDTRSKRLTCSDHTGRADSN